MTADPRLNHSKQIPKPTEGTRVRAVRFGCKPVPPGGGKDPETGLIRDAVGDVVTIDDNITVPPGTLGTVELCDDLNLKVEWDNGRHLGLIPGADEWEIVD